MATQKTVNLSVDASIVIGEALLPFAAQVTHELTEAKALSDVRMVSNVEAPIPLGNVPSGSMRYIIIRNQAEAGSTLRIQVGLAASGTWAASVGIQPLGDIAPGDCVILPGANPGVIVWRGIDRNTNFAAQCPAQILICPL